MTNTSMSAARAEMAKKVTIYHCERSLGVWCLINSSMAAAKDRNTCAHEVAMCIIDVRSVIFICL